MELIHFPVQHLFFLSYVSNSLSALTCKCSWRRWREMTSTWRRSPEFISGPVVGWFLVVGPWRGPDRSSGRSLPLLNQSSSSTPEQMLCFAWQTFYEMYMNYKGPGRSYGASEQWNGFYFVTCKRSQKAISTFSFCLENASCSSVVTHNTLHQSMAGKILAF